MTKRERAINKHITAIKTQIDNGELSLSAAVSVMIAKWMMDRRFSADLSKEMNDAFKKGRVMALKEVMTHWYGIDVNDDWGDEDNRRCDEQTVEILIRFWKDAPLFAGMDPMIIGTLYQRLLTTGHKKQNGIYYTPDNVAKKLIQLAEPFRKTRKILDPACGGGALLSAMYDRLMADHPGFSHEAALKNALWGIDSDPLAVLVCRAVLTLKSETYVFPQNIVRADALFDLDDPEWRDFDRVIANPPYIGHKALTSPYMDALRRQYPDVYGDKGDIAYCFYQNAVNRLKHGGTAVFLVSRYFTEARGGEGLRRFLSDKTRIKTIVDYNGERIIKGVGIDPMIIVFDKSPGIAGDIDVRKRVLTEKGESAMMPPKAQLTTHTKPDPKSLLLPGKEEALSRKHDLSEHPNLRFGTCELIRSETECDGNGSRTCAKKIALSARHQKSKLGKAEFLPQSFIIHHSSLTIHPKQKQLPDSETLPKRETLKAFNTFTIPQSTLGAEPWHLNDPMTRRIVDNIQDVCGTSLGAEVHFFQGVITGADRVFVFNREQKKAFASLAPYLKPWVKNSRVRPCRIDDSDYCLIYVQGEETDVSSELIAYLAPHRARLEKRRECTAGRIPWYALQWPRKPELFDGEKIIFPYKAEKNRFAVDDRGFYFSADIYGMIPEKIEQKSLCVLLNSACYNRYFKSFAKKLGGPLYEYYPNTLEKLAIPATNASIYCELAPYYDIIKTSNNAEAAMAAADNIIADYFGLNAAQKRYIGVGYAKKLF